MNMHTVILPVNKPFGSFQTCEVGDGNNLANQSH
jgi:hypothetical protein